MLIYSVMPPEVIFPPEEPPMANYQKISGGLVQLGQDGKVTRLITTDLSQYLKYSPGTPFV